MSKRLRGVIFGFIVAVFATISGYAIFEIRTFNDNTEEIETIYRGQLEAILFSLNQFSQDIADRWKSEINGYLLRMGESQWEMAPGDSSLSRMDIFLLNNASITKMHIVKDVPNYEDRGEIAFLTDSMRVKLTDYYKAGFQKIEPTRDQDDRHFLTWVTSTSEDTVMVILEIDPEIFIEEVLANRMESVSQDQFNVAAIDAQSGEEVYSTGDMVELNKETEQRSLWLFPDYSVVIEKQGDSISQLAAQRFTIELTILITVMVVLLIALFMVIRVVRRELELASAKSDFVSNVTHEIKTPLALISMFAETLELGRVNSEEKKKQYYEIIGMESQRLSRMINRILSFSKMEAGRRIYNFEELDLCEMIKEIFDTYRYHLTSKGFEYKLDCDGNQIARIDKESFTEVILNLLDNAIKFSKDVKKIEVKVERVGTNTQIVVKDYGIGISRHDQNHIFEKFYRSENALTQRTKGTGLGLNLVQDIIKAHNGIINVDSDQGNWTAFTIVFPTGTGQNN